LTLKPLTLSLCAFQDQVLGESTMMIGDCKTRMENAFNDLLAAVVRPTPSGSVPCFLGLRV